MLAFADGLRGLGAGLRVLTLGGGDVDTTTPMGSMLFKIMAALAQMEHEIKRERVTDSISNAEKLGRTLAADPSGSLTVRSEALSDWSKAASPLRRLPAI
jgi:DNA invertase Pin-like site-specific DNA recombinase